MTQLITVKQIGFEGLSEAVDGDGWVTKRSIKEVHSTKMGPMSRTPVDPAWRQTYEGRTVCVDQQRYN